MTYPETMAERAQHDKARAIENGTALSDTQRTVAEMDHARETRTTTSEGRYEIKCDDCKTIIGRTDNVGRSAQGGRCDECAA